MQKKRYTEERIVRILGEAEAGVKVDDLVRKYGVSRNTIYRWRSKYGGLEVSDVRRMKELEEENRRLKKIVAEMQSVFDLSERRSCALTGISRSVVQYERREDPADLVARLKELAAEQPRFGYRRLHVLLVREGRRINRKRVLRMYQEHGLQVRRKVSSSISSGPASRSRMRTSSPSTVACARSA